MAFFTPLATFSVVNGGIRGSFIQLIQLLQLLQFFFAHYFTKTKEAEVHKINACHYKGTNYADFTDRIHVGNTKSVLNRVIRA